MNRYDTFASSVLHGYEAMVHFEMLRIMALLKVQHSVPVSVPGARSRGACATDVGAQQAQGTAQSDPAGATDSDVNMGMEGRPMGIPHINPHRHT